MIARNPFSFKNAEQIDSTEEFIELYNVDAVSFIKADDLERVVVFQSSPGAGKSSLFRLMQPFTLREIARSKGESRADVLRFLKKRKAVDDNQNVMIAGALVSCAQNYGILEAAFDGADSEAAFQSLFNARLIVAGITALLETLNLSVKDASRIKFRNVLPRTLFEILGQNAKEGNLLDGDSLLWWALEREGNVLRQVENMEGSIDACGSANQMSAFALFERGNIWLDNSAIDANTLFMIDDLHLLTDAQRMFVLNTIMRQKPRVGIWIGERIVSYSVRENATLGTDGENGRDFHLYILEEQYGRGRNRDRIFIEIANRRAGRYLDGGEFASVIEERPDESVFDAPYMFLVEWLRHSVADYAEAENVIMSDWPTSKKAIYLRSLKIVYDRIRESEKHSGQMPKIDCGALLSSNNARLEEAAKFYICIENRIPYYCSITKLAQLSSNNMNQFLEIAGEVFDRFIAKSYVRNKEDNRVGSFEQERIISRIADAVWDSIPYRYSNGNDVQALLRFIISIGEAERKRGTASYAGGAYTGIGLKLDGLASRMQDSDAESLSKVISNAVAANYLCPQTIRSSDGRYQVLYLNRLFCAKAKLPLAYGGWRKVSLELLIERLREDSNG